MLRRDGPGRPRLHGLGPARRVMFRSVSAPLTTLLPGERRRALPPLDAAGVQAVAAPAPAPGAARAGDLAVTAAIARFEHHARMGSAEFAERYLRGEFGHAAWARVWFGLLQ